MIFQALLRGVSGQPGRGLVQVEARVLQGGVRKLCPGRFTRTKLLRPKLSKAGAAGEGVPLGPPAGPSSGCNLLLCRHA